MPAGAVGLAGEFSGVYPRPSPGGWQLIGRTDAALGRRPGPARAAHARHPVRFVDIAGVPMTSPLEVLATGPLVLVQDEAARLAAVGVGRPGAADRTAHRLGARLVGHPADRAALEVLLGGLAVGPGAGSVALTGAPAPATVDGRPVAHAALVHLADGAVLSLGMPSAGLRTYVTVRGGIDVARVLGSRSTDTLSGVGPPPGGARGTSCRSGTRAGPSRASTRLGAHEPPGRQSEGEEVVALEVLPGPRVRLGRGMDGR